MNDYCFIFIFTCTKKNVCVIRKASVNSHFKITKKVTPETA